jgi:hypothetical protein
MNVEDMPACGDRTLCEREQLVVEHLERIDQSVDVAAPRPMCSAAGASWRSAELRVYKWHAQDVMTHLHAKESKSWCCDLDSKHIYSHFLRPIFIPV